MLKKKATECKKKNKEVANKRQEKTSWNLFTFIDFIGPTNNSDDRLLL